MSKVKIFFYLVLAFIFYKGFVAFKNFEIGVDDRVTEIEEKADFEKEGEVISLMMYLGDPPKLYEHLLTKNSHSDTLYLLTGYVTHRNEEFVLELENETAQINFNRVINGFDIKLGSNYSLMSQIPDYGVNLKISNKF